MVDSIREALTAAIEKAEPTEKVETQSTAEPLAAVEGNSEPEGHDASASSYDDTGKDGGISAPSAEAATSTTPAPTPTPAPVVNAPASWTAEERAGWATAPEAVRKAVLRREGEMQRAFQASATARKRVEAIDTMSSQYRPLLERYGVTVEQAMPTLLATRAALEVGTPQQKAQLVANICADFGVEIGDLDEALYARFNGGRPQPIQPPQQVDFSQNPTFAPVFELMNEIKERRTAAAREMIATVAAQPHYEEVRFTMADLIEKAKANGRELPLDKAYGIACSFHGFDAPAATPSVTTSQAAAILARSRNAASSVTGAPQPSAPRKPGEGSLRDELMANMAATRR